MDVDMQSQTGNPPAPSADKGRVAQLDRPPGLIDFAVGQPDPGLLPVELIRRSAAGHMATLTPEWLQYGCALGPEPFRRRLATFLARSYDMPVSAGQLQVTAGASQALDLVCGAFTRPGDTVLVEEPTYFLALRILADRGLNIVGMPMDEHGLDPDRLAAAVDRHRPKMVYTIPTFHNPSAVTLPHERRRRIAALSQRLGFVLVADEVYHLLAYEHTPPPPMAAYDKHGSVVSLGSFSKILAPGLRLGWIQASAAKLEQIRGCGLLVSGGGINPTAAGIVAVALESGDQQAHLAHLKSVYRRRAARLHAALKKHLSQRVRFASARGGYFIWLRLPQNLDAADLLRQARHEQVGFQPGVRFSYREQLRDHLRLSFAHYDSPTLERGVGRLARALPPACRREPGCRPQPLNSELP